MPFSASPNYPSPLRDGKNIAVVVQGPVAGRGVSDSTETWHARECVKSVRKQLPGAWIVLSTWKGSDTTNIDPDFLIENEDPGTLINRNGCGHNFFRQLESTRKGLLAIPPDRPFALKIRTDMVLQGQGFLQAFERFQKRIPEWKVLQERIIGINYFTRHPRRGHFLFSWSDLIHFGLTSDLLALWDAPPFPITDQGCNEQGIQHWHSELDLLPEQILWSRLFRDHFDPALFTTVEARPANLLQVQEQALINNFLPLELPSFGVEWVGRSVPLRRQMNVYSQAEIERLYQKLCDPGHQPMRFTPGDRIFKEGLYLVAGLGKLISRKG